MEHIKASRMVLHLDLDTRSLYEVEAGGFPTCLDSYQCMLGSGIENVPIRACCLVLIVGKGERFSGTWYLAFSYAMKVGDPAAPDT